MMRTVNEELKFDTADMSHPNSMLHDKSVPLLASVLMIEI